MSFIGSPLPGAERRKNQPRLFFNFYRTSFKNPGADHRFYKTLSYRCGAVIFSFYKKYFYHHPPQTRRATHC